MTSWTSFDYFLRLSGMDASLVAEAVFAKVFRTSFAQPGFAIVILDEGLSSHQQRRIMIELKNELSRLHEQQWREGLRYLSVGRFNQQTNTKLHLDGAPERSFLMLGYEATEVRSQFLLADFSRCAHDLGMNPGDFLQHHNPMFSPGAALLRDHTTTIADWHENQPRIVLVNNSSSGAAGSMAVAGVLHGAVISEPQPHQRRIINSTMMAPANYAGNDAEALVTEFATTDRISGSITMAADA